MRTRLYSYLDNFNLLRDLQFAFRKGHFTNHLLERMVENVGYNLDKGNYTYGIFVQPQKAFDSAHHDRLLRKLDHYGIRGNVNECYRCFLSDIAVCNGRIS